MTDTIKRKNCLVVGYGSVGRAFTRLLYQKNFHSITLAEIEGTPNWGKAVEDGIKPVALESINDMPELVFLAVSDQHIQHVAASIANLVKSGNETKSAQPGKNCVFHFSGRMGLDVLDSLKDAGYSRVAFHPIQTFPTGADAARFDGITFGVTKDVEAEKTVDELVQVLGVEKLDISEEHRADYHLASVLASNFLPLLLDLGAKRLVATGVDYEKAWKALIPLVRGMVESMGQYGPHNAATGPVIRDDFEAVTAHSANLENHEIEFYIQLTEKLAALLLEGDKKDQEQYDTWKRVLKSISEN